MDLCLNIEDYKLNIRAAGLIVHGNKLLLHKNLNSKHCCLPGGRVEIGESSDKTVKREILEEMGKELEIVKYVSTIENFFEKDGYKYHEIYFLYRIEFKEEKDKEINYTLPNVEGKEYLKYEWVDIDKIEECNILPRCLKDVLKDGSIRHKINNDLKE